MERWRNAWRKIAKHLPTAGLEALREALEGDDLRLRQGMTCFPPPLSGMSARDEPVMACAIAFCGWQAGAKTVGEVGDFFISAVKSVPDHAYFTAWHDETPRDKMRRNLLPEVERELERRAA